MTPRTDTDLGYDVRTGSGPAPARERVSFAVQGWDRRRARVSWSHALPFAVVLAFANGFWLIALRGAIGAIERSSAPFSTWLRESSLLVPVYVGAVLAAFMLAQRWFGARPGGFRPVMATIATVAAAGAAAGTVLLVVSSWFDFRLQRTDLHHMGAVHPGCDTTCAAARVQATLNLEVKGVWLGLLLMLLTDLLLVGLLVAFRGGVIVLAKEPRAGSTRRRDDARVILAAALVGAAAVHAAVVPEHLAHWAPAGIFFLVLAMAEVATAGAVLARAPAWRVRGPVAAVVVSAVPLLLWTVSRTTGLPFGTGTWKPGAAGVADVLACALEVTTLAIAAMLLRRRSRRPSSELSTHGLALALTAVVAVTVVGIGGATLPVVGAFSHLGEEHPGHSLPSLG